MGFGLQARLYADVYQLSKLYADTPMSTTGNPRIVRTASKDACLDM